MSEQSTDPGLYGTLSTGSEAARGAGQPRRSQFLAVLLILAVLATEFAGFLFAASQQNAVISIRNQTRDVRIVQQAVADAEESVTDYVIGRDVADLARYAAAIQILQPHRKTTFAALDSVAPLASASGKQMTVLAMMQGLENDWQRAIELVRAGESRQALVLAQGVHRRISGFRSSVTRYLAIRNAEADKHEERGTLTEIVVLLLQLVGGTLSLFFVVNAFRSSEAEARGRRVAIADAVAAREQIERLFRMTDMLQSASGYADANAVLHATAHGLMPDLGCALFIFNNSRDRLDLSTAWNLPEGYQPPEYIAPTSCWAVKRGKTHLNEEAPGSLRCDHQAELEGAILEVPMMARGELYGLLTVIATGADAEERIRSVHSMATALAEAMSLALSNIALREKLRNQALRDPLTGLYNRRYMEDMLERFAQLSERTERPLSVIMIDLDHFKRLNDDHGHGTGDAVLRDVAGAISGALRQSDVACRYGGEELIVLLPDSGLADALTKAETLRARVESLSEKHGVRITASFGVAASPENASGTAELVKMADAALYDAKRSGRNRVAAASSQGPMLIAAE